jgi:sterol desaturase/sphingolipid hydroxylase (fatty acid hydroxylase superfamily)
MEEPMLNYAAFAIPVFLLFMVIEFLVGKSRKEEIYHLGTAASDIGCGIIFQASEFFFKAITFGFYIYLYENYSLIQYTENSWIPWVVSIVGIDFLFYWWHRKSHEINVMWAVHGVHHQSEDYNLAVALRQPLFEPITWFLFYIPLAFLGVGPLHYLAGYGLNRLYQFFIHTELVGKLGVLETFLNTPSHHRVHHGVQTKYLDRNYGAIFIIWDRIFGTFQVEEEAPVYGITTPIRTYNSLWANFLILDEIRLTAKKANNWKEKFIGWFAHPGWAPSNLPPAKAKPDPSRETFQKYIPELKNVSPWYLVFSALLIAVVTFLHVLYETRAPHWILGLSAFAVITAQLSINGWTESKSWTKIMEPVRILLLIATLIAIPYVI